MQAEDARSLDRRRFLTGVVLCLSGSLLPEALASSVAAGSAAAHWLTLFTEPQAAMAVGRQYLRQHPREASAAWLATSLFGGESCLSGSDAAFDRSMEEIRRRRQRDFDGGDLVVIDGWFFSRTEARLLALLSMRPA